jgi:AmmeMemoRadiSam system protein B/AmmeMemoRadiSam system protein A
VKWLRENPVWIAVGAVLIVFAGIVGLAAWGQKSQQRETGTATATAQAKLTRKMAVAGTFYPREAESLNTQLEKYLNAAPKKADLNPIRILIVPHAGLDYSGPVAGVGFKQIAGTEIKRVIILGSSHYHQFDEAAVIADGEWETPLGNVEIDDGLAKKIISPGQKIVDDRTVHLEEHSLEMEVIWLKKVLPDFKMVPILVSQPNEELISALAYRIAQNMDEQTLLVISTDLSHYPDYPTANKVDKMTIDAILSGNIETQVRSLPGVETTACGYESLRVGLKVAELLQLDLPQLLKYANSGDVTDNKDRVVGYAAIAIGSKEVKLQTPQLSEAARAEALEIAQTTLVNWVRDKKLPEEINVKNPILTEPLGAFVTINKNGSLRGCIGEFEPAKPLYQVIQEKTVDAASKDLRFNPVTPDELPEITLEISVMTPRQKINDWHQIKLETDGVVLVQGNRSGTFLPQVAKQTKWDLEEFLSELCSQKAGLPKNCYQQPTTEFYVYQAQVFD